MISRRLWSVFERWEKEKEAVSGGGGGGGIPSVPRLAVDERTRKDEKSNEQSEPAEKKEVQTPNS
jgi:hypothetical protein